MPALDRIEVKGFKSIRQMDLELRPLNVLIGANGSGKSNFISVFRFLNAMVERRLQVYVGQAGGVDNLLYFGRQTSYQLEVRLNFGNNGYYAGFIPDVDNRLIFSGEQCWYRKYEFEKRNAEVTSSDLGGGHIESELEKNLLPEFKDVWGDVLEAIKSWIYYHFHDTSDTSRIKVTQDLNDNQMLRPDASNLAAYLYLLREKHRPYYDKIVKTIRLVAPFFDDFSLQPNPLNMETILLRWRERGVERDLSASLLSDGTLRFICLATLLLQPKLPSTILIDEPELGLHPYAIGILAELLQSASVDTQVIVSTQSVSLIDEFKAEDIIVVEREEGQSTFKRLNTHQLEGWLEEYALSELWEKNIIGGRPTRWELQWQKES